jgi:hypothetical protein
LTVLTERTTLLTVGALPPIKKIVRSQFCCQHI